MIESNRYACHDRVIQAAAVKNINVSKLSMDRPMVVKEFTSEKNTILYVVRGEVHLIDEVEIAKAGELLVIPAKKKVNLGFLSREGDQISGHIFENIMGITANTSPAPALEVFVIQSDVLIYNAFQLFKVLELPAFVLKIGFDADSKIRDLYAEFLSKSLGYEKILSTSWTHFVALIIRDLAVQEKFYDKFHKNSIFFKDDRLIDIFEYVQNNLEKDLSNNVLAGIVNVSEDYVGQYFKNMTGIKLQDFVEKQRMEEAVDLLVNTTGSVRDISVQVGFHDVAYFCRRFKKVYGMSARKLRVELTGTKYAKMYEESES